MGLGYMSFESPDSFFNGKVRRESLLIKGVGGGKFSRNFFFFGSFPRIERKLLVPISQKESFC